jgi:predicted transcriptional regulator
MDLTVSLDDATASALAAIAKERGVSLAALVEEALLLYSLDLGQHEQRAREGRADIAEGRYAAHAELRQWLGSWGSPDEQSPPRCD